MSVSPWKVSGSGALFFASSSSSTTCSDGSPRRDLAGWPLTPTMSPRSTSTLPASSWIRPLRSTRSRKVIFPISRRASTRPASRNVCDSSVAPGSSASAASRTMAIPSRSGKRLGSMAGSLRGLDVEDLVLQRSSRGRDLDGLTLLLADDRLPHRRLVRELQLCGICLGRADDEVLVRAPGVDVAKLHLRADGDDAEVDVAPGDHARVQEALLELRDLVLEHRLLVLGVVVLGVLGDVAELARDTDPVRDLAPLLGREQLDLLLQLLIALGRENDFLQLASPKTKAGGNAPTRVGMVAARRDGVNTCEYHPQT